MTRSLYIILNYVRYLFTAKTKHGIHSPFVFHLLVDVIHGKQQNSTVLQIEERRLQLLRNKAIIRVEDFGAGSRIHSSPERKISQIARHSVKSRKYGRLLYRLSHHFRPEIMLELGTSLGISALYLSQGNPEGQLTTIEGSREIAEIAKESFDQCNAGNINSITGRFADTLPAWLATQAKLDLVFFDGDHKKESTLRYFSQCLEKAHNDSVFIFDDIYWSEEMTAAWKEISEHPKVTVTVDLFHMGLVFFRQEQVKQHFKIKF